MFSLVLLALADGAGGKTGGEAARAAARNAAQMAGGLAARHGAGFAVLVVSGPLGQEGGCVLQLPGEDEQSARRARVETLLREVMPGGLTADVMHAAGFAHVEVLKTARILGPDLLVLGGLDETERCRRELSGEEPGARAGAAALVAASAPCPALVAPAGPAGAEAAPAQSGPFERLLVAVDLADDAATCRALLDFAARVAAREGAELCVAHTLALPDADAAHEEMTRRVAAARERLAYLCHGLPGADRFTLLAGEGAAGVEILKHARERAADLLVLGVRADGSGPVLARVLAGARCPVLLAGPAVLRGERRPVAAAGAAAREDRPCRNMS